ncbi:T9SS sorting signal type C domain-containing protein [Flavobacterium sp. LC2016-12]|uniref:T9SS sorting signal type C domain-containing protein n=1 Tax=Flavobacterium sp. LC2016-12 TaxID=2783794 RepID=UPI00188DB46A|nr:T9SS sorting signal type C domain-containing protein [Flavobacterium sp. LC2016-12]MBF4466092.1 T9SS sorting signal type C domain-containing protein [Flavobacterium sp. LC2016-12]
MDKKLLIIFSMLFCFAFANGATITSTGINVDWSNTTSWVGGVVPTVNDDVIIATGSTMIISSNVSAKSLTINGTLIISGDHTLTTSGGNTLNVVINGTLAFGTASNKNSITFPVGTVIDINGPGGKINTDGTCNNNVAIYIGAVKFAVCAGGGNAEFTFADLNAAGGTLQSKPTSTSPVCEGTTLTFIAASEGAPGSSLSGQWSIINPLGTTTTYPISANVTISNALVGTYTATLSYSTTYGSTAYSNAKTISAIVNPRASTPTITPSGATTFCIGGSVTLTSSAGSGYLWSTGATTPSIVVTASGNYTVQVTNGSGCQSLASNATAVTVNPKPAIPTIAPSGPTTFCVGGSVTLTSSVGSSYLWSTGATTPSIVVTTAGNYTVQITNASGCQSLASNATTVTVNPKPATPAITPSGSTTFCEGGSVTLTSSVGSSYLWSTGATTPNIVVTGSGSYSVQVTNAAGCQSLSSIPTAVTVNSKPVAPTITPSGSTTFCNGDSVTLTSSSGTSYLWSTGATTPSIVVTTAGDYSVQVTNGSGCQSPPSANTTVTIKPLLPVPNVFNIIQPTCTVSTGSIVLNNLPMTTLAIPNWTIQQTGSVSRSYVGGGDADPTTYTISNLAPGFYNFTIVFGDNCPVTINNVEVKTAEANIWKGPVLGWSKGSAPSSAGTESIEFAADYQSIGDLASCSCKVDAGKLVTINAGHTLYVENEIVVESGAGAKLTFENNASLVQLNDVTNTGNIIYKRNTAPVRRYDYTFWSSPVTRTPAFTLEDLSPDTLGDKYYKYHPVNGWLILGQGLAEMVKGVGYIIRAPQYYDLTIPAVYSGSFIGVPNNGPISVPLIAAESSSLLGNPYPSAIYADEFILDNSDNLYGTLYFWTHNSPPSKLVAGDATYNYTLDDYAVYNLTGSVDVGHLIGTGATTGPNHDSPKGYIAAGQSFFATSKTNLNAIFTNSMRVSGNNAQFFKTNNKTTIESHKVWINLSNTQGAFKQLLIGYLDGATNSWDNNYDGPTIDGNKFVDFYSTNGAEKLIIQGRSLPFEENDFVTLGYKSSIAGEFKISIDHASGDLETHAIYLEDKMTNTFHDLRSSDYKFTTTIGTFNDRFILRYLGKTLGKTEFQDSEQAVLVSTKDKIIKVTSSKEIIDEITIFDLTGKVIYHRDKIDSTEFQIANIQSGDQILLVKVSLENGATSTIKVIF